MIKKRGKMLLCNGTPVSLQYRKDVQCQIEVQHNSYYAFEGNLNTPLGYMSWSSSWDDFLRVFDMAMLPAHGLQTELPHDISPFLFPFTTIEIHAGYMLAKERIVATHSGNYGWVGKRCLAQVRHFNNKGKLDATDYPTRLGTEARTAVNLQAKEAIVLERLPISFDPDEKKSAKKSTWNAEAQKVHYDDAEISLHLTAPQGGVLKINTGEFILKDNSKVTVSIGDENYSLKVSNGSLLINIPAGFSGGIGVKQNLSSNAIVRNFDVQPAQVCYLAR